MAQTKRMSDFVQRNHKEAQIQGADLDAVLKVPSFIAIKADLYCLEPVIGAITILCLADDIAGAIDCIKAEPDIDIRTVGHLDKLDVGNALPVGKGAFDLGLKFACY